MQYPERSGEGTMSSEVEDHGIIDDVVINCLSQIPTMERTRRVHSRDRGR